MWSRPKLLQYTYVYIYKYIVGSTILPFFGNFDGYLAKYDSSGNLLWANDIGGSDADKAYSTAIDDSDNIYVVGGFMSNHLRFSASDSIALTSAGNQNFFVAKYDKNGNFLWARNGGKASPASYAFFQINFYFHL